MHVALTIVILAVVVTAFSAVSRRYSLSAPLVLVAVGFAASYPPVHHDPPQVHSDKHWRTTGHPVIRSFETGEAWRWCYDHQLLG